MSKKKSIKLSPTEFPNKSGLACTHCSDDSFKPPCPKGFHGKIYHIVELYGLFPVIPLDEVGAKRQRKVYFGETGNATIDDALIQDPLLPEAANPERQELEVAPNAFVPPTGLVDQPLPNGPTDEVYTDLRNRTNTEVYDVTGIGNISPFGCPLYKCYTVGSSTNPEQIGYDHGELIYTQRGINGIRTPGEDSFKLAASSNYNTQYPENPDDPYSADSFTCIWNFVLPGGTVNTMGLFESSANIDSIMAITGGTGDFLGASGQMYCHPRGGNAPSSNDPSSSVYDVFLFVEDKKSSSSCKCGHKH